MPFTRSLAVLTLLLAVGATATAQVVRCEDGAGNVSYNDIGCKPGARRSELILTPEAPRRTVPTAPPADTRRQEQVDSAERPGPFPRESVDAAAPQPQAPGRVIILDPRADERAGRDAAEAPYAPYSPYSPDPYGEVRPRPYAQPQQDMRPRIRNCGPSGCQDTQGNHYDRSGKLDRYVRPDGRTCRPVGTTVVCQ